LITFGRPNPLRVLVAHLIVFQCICNALTKKFLQGINKISIHIESCDTLYTCGACIWNSLTKKFLQGINKISIHIESCDSLYKNLVDVFVMDWQKKFLQGIMKMSIHIESCVPLYECGAYVKQLWLSFVLKWVSRPTSGLVESSGPWLTNKFCLFVCIWGAWVGRRKELRGQLLQARIVGQGQRNIL
jgi:hypothetical protein